MTVSQPPDMTQATRVRIGIGKLQNVLHDDEGTAAGDCSEKHQRQKFYGNAQKIKDRAKRDINKVYQPGGGQTVDGKINSNHKRKNFNSCFQPVFGAFDEIVIDRGFFNQAAADDQSSHNRQKADGNCRENRAHIRNPFFLRFCRQ